MKSYEVDFSQKGRDYKEKFMRAIKDSNNITFDYEGRVMLIRDPKIMSNNKMNQIIDEPIVDIPDAYHAKQSTKYEWLK